MCLNRFVIFRMCGEEKVKVAHFVLFSVFLVVGGVTFRKSLTVDFSDFSKCFTVCYTFLIL